MSIYIMKGSTFKDIYAKTEDPNKIFRTQHRIVSSRIRTLDHYHDIVKLTNVTLFPSDHILADFGCHDKNFFEKEYRKQLKCLKADLARFVYSSMINKTTFIFICSDKEWKLGYLQIMKDFIEEYFHYPVYDYKKYKTGKEAYRQFNQEYVEKVCKKELSKKREEEFAEGMKTEKGRKKILKSLSTAEMRTVLRNSDLYIKGMSKKEMKYVLKTYVFC